jgi:hypothetical protein
MADLLPHSTQEHSEDLPEDVLELIDGPSTSEKRRDTGLSGKYWASLNLPAKRKRISVVERKVVLR